MDRSLALRTAALQALGVIAISLALAVALPRSFFEEWGWLSGPAAWMACAALTARLLGLPAGWTLAGAVLAGLPSILAVIAGVHWLGAALAIALFALWCGFEPRGPSPRRQGTSTAVHSRAQ